MLHPDQKELCRPHPDVKDGYWPHFARPYAGELEEPWHQNEARRIWSTFKIAPLDAKCLPISYWISTLDEVLMKQKECWQ